MKTEIAAVESWRMSQLAKHNPLQKTSPACVMGRGFSSKYRMLHLGTQREKSHEVILLSFNTNCRT